MTGQNKKWKLDKLIKTEYFVEQSILKVKYFLKNWKNKVRNNSQFIKLFIDFVKLGKSSLYERFTRVMRITVRITNVKQ